MARLVVPIFVSTVACIVAEPAATAVMTSDVATVAMPVLSDDQETERP